LALAVSLLTLGRHDFKQSLEDAAKVTGIVGLQLVSDTCSTTEHNIGIEMRPWQSQRGGGSFYLIYKQRDGG